MSLEISATCTMPSKFPEAAMLGGKCGYHVHGRSFREVKAQMRLHYIDKHEAGGS